MLRHGNGRNRMIRPINFTDIPENFIAQAKKERISFLTGEGIYYWGAFETGQLVGCTCLIIYKNGHGKIKSNYVLKEYRGSGIFKALNEVCLEFAKSKGITNIILNCLADSVDIHLKAGAVIYKETKTIKYLVYRL